VHKLCLSLLTTALVIGPSAWGESLATPEHYYQVITDTTFEAEEGYQQEFGYSVIVRFEGASVLFDTGVTPKALEQNLKTADIDPKSIDILVLSHNHSDHIGGISYIRKTNSDIVVYAAPGQEIDEHPVTRLEKFERITPNLYAIRTHTDSPTSGISDELSLVMRTDQGPYLLTGCSHTGVSRIVKKATEIIGQPIFHYTGGARLKLRALEDTEHVANELTEMNVSQISPGHCSVDHRVDEALKEYFHGQVLMSVQGRKVTLMPPDQT